MCNSDVSNNDISVDAEATGNRQILEVIIVGAGMGGLAMLHHVQNELQMSVRALEAGSDVGGTWYWNRYPGARTDSEAWYYCFSFAKDLLQQWDWNERYPSQPEVLEHIRAFADHFDLRKNVQFGSKVQTARYLADENLWCVTTTKGETFRSKYLIFAFGPSVEPYVPDIKGLDRFGGEWYQTQRWPNSKPDFRGKRVGLIGTGSTGIQLAPIIAETAAHLTVFQRTANYVLPIRNHALDQKMREDIRANYDAIWHKVRSHSFGMPFENSGRLAVETSQEERQNIFEEGWRKGGFRYLFETFDDILVNAEANKAAADFIREKIRQTVKDPHTAELLCPKDHPYGGKRPPGGNGYYEMFNRDNVSLVDIKKNVISEITPEGIRLADGTQNDLDVIIFATGFDNVTGPFTAIEIYGEGGVLLRDKWKQGPRTFLGLATSGFPNMFMVNGPLTPFANIPPCIEKTAAWISTYLSHLRENEVRRAEILPTAEDEWIKEVEDCGNMTLVPLGEEANSWVLGANIPGKAIAMLTYLGGLNTFIDKCDDEMAKGYPHFTEVS
jgi:cation diffusion facilitator CzcD-associated flavoprotein CzcO